MFRSDPVGRDLEAVFHDRDKPADEDHRPYLLASKKFVADVINQVNIEYTIAFFPKRIKPATKRADVLRGANICPAI